LEDKLEAALIATSQYMEDVHTIKILADGTFTFTSTSGMLNASGTYSQENSYIIFKCLTGHFPEVGGELIGATDGVAFELYPSKHTLTPIFLPFLTNEEQELFFGKINPTEVVQGVIFYSRAAAAAW
jgi:hypothetical protein